ncbi:hypothetical protein FACS1894109_01660 [Spirochaetia bacterium]|nr:hypothetical protein FACS1894109_01660 [Spirochaetia bacterium]
MDNISTCGLNCNKCEFKLTNGCKGCRENQGKIFWGECDLYKCCMDKNINSCGKCMIIIL